jgi:hypothetical protein
MKTLTEATSARLKPAPDAVCGGVEQSGLVRLVRSFLFDLRYVPRAFWKAPTPFVVAILTLAIGIGATIAMFTVVNSVLLRLPFGHPDRLVRFTAFDPAHQTPFEISYAEIVDWRRTNAAFEDITGIGSTNSPFVLDGDEPVSVQSSVVSGTFFDVVDAGLLRMVVAFDPSGFLAAYPLEIDIRVVVVTLAIAARRWCWSASVRRLTLPGRGQVRSSHRDCGIECRCSCSNAPGNGLTRSCSTPCRWCFVDGAERYASRRARFGLRS